MAWQFSDCSSLLCIGIGHYLVDDVHTNGCEVEEAVPSWQGDALRILNRIRPMVEPITAMELSHCDNAIGACRVGRQ